MILNLYTEEYFNAAHKIDGYKGECANVHGHTWKVGVWVKGKKEHLSSGGILWDFNNLKKIKAELDHTFLNNVVNCNPTAENIVLYIYEKLKSTYSKLEFKVRVYENFHVKKSYAETGDF